MIIPPNQRISYESHSEKIINRLLTIIDQFSSEDGARIVTRFHSRQKHEREFFGLSPTGRIILFDETHVATVQNGKIIQNIVSATNLEFEMLMAPILTPMILK